MKGCTWLRFKTDAKSTRKRSISVPRGVVNILVAVSGPGPCVRLRNAANCSSNSYFRDHNWWPPLTEIVCKRSLPLYLLKWYIVLSTADELITKEVSKPVALILTGDLNSSQQTITELLLSGCRTSTNSWCVSVPSQWSKEGRGALKRSDLDIFQFGTLSRESFATQTMVTWL